MATRVDIDRMLELVGEGAVLADVLPAKVYGREHLPGAISLPLAEVTLQRLEAFDRGHPLVLYCFDQH